VVSEAETKRFIEAMAALELDDASK